MGVYIDREQALSHPFANGKYDHEHANEHFILGFESYREWLEQLSTIDLVRCGECKWGNKDNEGTLWCEHAIGGIMKPTDFCSYRERRADEHTD